ncbi:MAG: peptidase U32 family protein [Nanobdellota archaeon]
MQIVAAFSNLEELESIIKNGADEVYCGLLKTKQLPTINHRPNSSSMNLKDLEELGKAIKITHKYKKKINLVINEVGCIFSSLKRFIEVLKKIDSIGIDGFIISDLVLIEALKKVKINLKADLTLSSVTPCLNSSAANYFKNRGIKRFVVPQHLYPDEIKKIKKKVDIKTEVFFFGTNYCRNIDGFCFYTYNKQLWKGEIPLDACDNIKKIQHFSEKKKKSSLVAKRIFSYPVHQDPFGAIYDYWKVGVNCIKLGNREEPTKQKIKNIKIAKHMKDKLNTNPSKKNFVFSCKAKTIKLLY